MNTTARLELAKDQLNRILDFFSRIDTKGSVVLAIDTGMLAFLFTRAPTFNTFNDSIIIFPLLSVLLIATSLIFLFCSGSPSLNGGHQSLIYFREIALRTEAKYIDESMNVSEEAYLRDVLGQVWRNSEILKKKFDHVKWAFRFLALAIVPWVIALLLFAMRSASVAETLVSK